MRIDHYLRADLADVPATASGLEELGFDGLYTAEGPHEPFFPLAVAAGHTTRATLFTNIAIAFARSPMDLAQMADGLQRVSGGRFVLGLGSQIRPHIEKRFSMTWSRPVARMREMVQAIKAIQTSWAETTRLEYRGEIYHHTLMTPMFDPGPNPHGPPPVWVAGLGPKMTQCAATVADGLLVHPFHTDRFIRDHVTPAVTAGLAESGRDRAAFTVSATPIVCTGATDDEMAEARTRVRGLLGFYGSTPAYRVTLDAHGWGELQGELNRLTKEGRWDDISEVLPDEVVDTIAVCCRPEEVADRLRARYADAVDRVGLSMPYEASRDTLAAIVAGFRR
ncbi:MAG: TIGR03617 family F420-dependent LLM class oxidoreductase [Acidimicrobiia bacterium]